ncbi:MAG TPA: Arc family DNA-binding protein [Acetobacteraceae bacterium]|nr:Arc family DNA-binding protein [Acetobacteraceae bacterium]
MTLSIKNVPDDLADRLRQQAARNHRSLQGELLAILESVAGSPSTSRIDEIYARVQASGVQSPREASRMVRRDRDDPGR